MFLIICSRCVQTLVSLTMCSLCFMFSHSSSLPFLRQTFLYRCSQITLLPFTGLIPLLNIIGRLPLSACTAIAQYMQIKPTDNIYFSAQVMYNC